MTTPLVTSGDTFHQAWQNLIDDMSQIAQRIVDDAGLSTQQSERKQDGSLLTQTDLALQHAISDCLLQHFADIPVLGEEMSEAEQQALLDTGTCWLLDPLDGTSNFSHGIPVFSVSCALLQQGEVVAGMVYDPNRHECFSAIKGKGAYLNKQPLVRNAAEHSGELNHAMAIIDLKRLSKPLATAIATQNPYHSQRSFGSVALDWCWLAAGRVHTYAHGKQKLWDFSAGALIAQEAGCLTSTLAGHDILTSPLDLKPRSAIGACPALAVAWPQWVKANE